MTAVGDARKRLAEEHAPAALVDPVVGAALADLLAGWADDIEAYGGTALSDGRTLALARFILRETGGE